MDQQQTQKIDLLNLTLTPVESTSSSKPKKKKADKKECELSFKQICERSKKRGYKSFEDAESDLKNAMRELEELRKSMFAEAPVEPAE